MKRILAINAANIKEVFCTDDVSLSSYFLEKGLPSDFTLILPKSLEEVFRVLKSSYLDLIIVTFFGECDDQIDDFFQVLRKICFITPILGIGKSEYLKTLPFDIIVPLEIAPLELHREIKELIKIHDRFDDELIQNFKFAHFNKSIIYCGKRLNRLKSKIFDPEIRFFDYFLTHFDQLKQANLFIIDADIKNAIEIYFQIIDGFRHKTVIFAYDENSNKNVVDLIKLKDVNLVNLSKDRNYVSTKIRSLIKYDQIYSAFVKKIKKSMYLATIDSTTKVYTRAFLDEYLIEHDQVLKNFSTLVIDIDKFKSINDKYGHYEADKILKNIANLIKNNIRSTDIVARYGGDEFIVIMQKISKHELKEITLRIRKVIEASEINNIKCSVSIGGCYLDKNDSMTIEKAISIADKFMYIAKEQGGNAIKLCG